jgi:hypothetical protein
MDASVDFIKNRRPDFHETRKTISTNHDRYFDSVVDPGNYDIAWIAEPMRLNVRLDRQEGTFLIAGNREKKIADLLKSEIYNNAQMEKLIISGKLYQQAWGLLRKVNLTSKSIYGDLVGLAQTIRMELQAYARVS